MAGFPTPSIIDPTQQAGREKRAYADFRRRLRAIYAEINERVIGALNPREIALNGARSYILNRDTFYYYEPDRSKATIYDDSVSDDIIEIDNIMECCAGMFEQIEVTQ